MTTDQDKVKSPTELRNRRTADIDRLPTLDVLRRINAEDTQVPAAVASALPELAEAVDAAVESLRAGGRVHYFGAGTSGRIGTMDAAELPPTYGIDPDLVVAHQAGGSDALDRALEDVEDDENGGVLAAAEVTASDVVLGLAASGRTPYVIGAIKAARAAGATSVLVTSNPDAPLASAADIHVAVDTGPEVIAGSTRMKAGTAQKLVLNTFSTAVMVRLGHTYSNLMIGMLAKNSKLRGRTVTVLVEASGQDERTCEGVLERSGGDARVALTSLLSGAPVEEARQAVTVAGGSVRAAVTEITKSP